MSLRTTLLATIGALALASGAASGAHAATYSFANLVGTGTPLSVTAGGVTATFASSAGAGVFSVGSTSGLFTFPVGLGDFASFSGDPLTISFSQPVLSAVSIPFGIEDAFGLSGSDSLRLTANTGQTLVAGTTLNGLPLAEPQGIAAFVPTAAITSLTLTSANPFAIASVDVPEPMSITLLGVGLAGFAATRRKSRAA